jgi:hypothetical protein
LEKFSRAGSGGCLILRKGLHPALPLALLAAVVFLFFFGIHRYRHRHVRQPVDIVRLLPAGDESMFFADVALLRRVGYLGLTMTASAHSEPDYRQFVQNTNFDYARDVDAIAGIASPNQIALFVKGRFDWSRLQAYAQSHAGSCDRNECSLPASKPGQWISFSELQPDVMAVAVNSRRDAAAALTRAKPNRELEVPSDPVWLHPAHSLLQTPNALPFGLRMFAIALQAADSIIVSLGPSNEATFDLKLKARFENAAAADTARNQLEIDTKMLRLELAREHAKASNGDVTGLLTAGTFLQSGAFLTGVWPVHQELLEALR